MTVPLRHFALLSVALLFVMACTDREIGGVPGLEASISDGVHESGTPGFYFLPPMVPQPTFSGTFDADITTLNPAVAICDVTNGPDSNCGGAGGTPAVIVFTTTSAPAIRVDLTTPQYLVNWDTKGAGFTSGHTYRAHVKANAGDCRSDLGFADVLLTTTSGQVKQLSSGSIVVLQDGRTLPIHFRIETGISPKVIISTSSMVAWWRGEGNANDAVDGNNGTLNGGVTFSAAEVGQGFLFSNDLDEVTIPDNPALNVQSPGFSADLWVRGIKNQPENLATVFEKSHGWTDATGWAFQIGSVDAPNGGTPRFYLSDGTFSDIVGSVDVLDGNFHYLAGTWDGSVTRFYVDAVLQGTASNSAPANNNRPVNIGFTWGGGNPRRFFRGTADELRVFNRALSQSEIQSIFAAGSAGNCQQ